MALFVGPSAELVGFHMTKKEPTIDPGQGNTPPPFPKTPVSHLWSPGLAGNARRGRMSIVEGAQRRMFAFPAGPAAPRGQLGRGGGGRSGRGRGTEKRGEDYN